MTTQTLERPETIPIQKARQTASTPDEPNFGPQDMHAIRAIFGIIVGIFAVALVMYSTITFCAWW